MTKQPKLTVDQPDAPPKPPIETPTQAAIREAVKEATVIDVKGRKITLRKPDVLAQYRIVKIAGPEAAKNEVYMGMIMPIIFVVAIDAEPVYFPQTEAELEATIQRLDEHGLEAVMKCMTENWGTMPDEKARAAAIKK